MKLIREHSFAAVAPFSGVAYAEAVEGEPELPAAKKAGCKLNVECAKYCGGCRATCEAGICICACSY